jgi:hypothetical protein
VFISDTLHNRVIISDRDGTVIDCIGSVAGFEDGPFETSQLHSPASTSFHAETNCLFIADCEVLPHGSQNLLDPGLGLRNKYIVAQT